MATSYSEILRTGLLLPFHVMFQPQRTIIRLIEMPNSMIILSFLHSLIWVVVAMPIGMLLFGYPPNLLADVVFFPFITWVASAVLAFRSRLVSTRTGNRIIAYPALTAVAVYGAIVLGWAGLIGRLLHLGTGTPLVRLIGGWTAERPTDFALGMMLGLMAITLLGTQSPRLAVIETGILSLISLVIGAIVRSPSWISTSIVTGVIATHLIFQPIYLVISLISYSVLQLNPSLAPILWTISPAQWSEFAYVPLVGLRTLVTTLYRQDQTRGQTAILSLLEHSFYARLGWELCHQLGTVIPLSEWGEEGL